MKKSFAFSLVEVVAALGIFAVCAIAILGLLSQGLNTDRSSGQEQDASSIIQQLVVGLQDGKLEPDGKYTPLAPLSTSLAPEATNTLNGVIGNYAYWIRTKPASTNSTGLIDARIEIAWPSQAVTGWDDNGQVTGKPSGSGSLSSHQFFFIQ